MEDKSNIVDLHIFIYTYNLIERKRKFDVKAKQSNNMTSKLKRETSIQFDMP